MSIRKSILLPAALMASVAIAQPAFAQAMTVGAKVSDTAGGAVGTITAVEEGYVTLKTDKHEVRFPVASFTKVEDGYMMAMTQAQVNAAAEASLAQAQALITVGAAVRGSGGAVVGVIDALDDQYVTLKIEDKLIKLPRAAVGAGASGPVLGMTEAELAAAVASAAPAAPEATADASAAAE
jgi:preprotein translocase subunit YajC